MENYTLTFTLGKSNKKGLCKIYLRYYSKSHDYLLFKNTFRVLKTDFNTNDSKAPVRKSNPNYAIINSNLNNFRIEVESRIHSLVIITKDGLEGKKATSDKLVHFIEDYYDKIKSQIDAFEAAKNEGKETAKPELTFGRLKHYNVIKNKILAFDAKVTFQQISKQWIKKFENSMRATMSQNTLNSKISLLISVLNKAAGEKLLSKEQFEGYVRPGEEEKIPEYLTETEIDAFYEVVKSTANQKIKTCGYYFLLSCHAGYRISDLFTFKYEDRVKDNKIVLRAKKNGTIVSIPIYSKLSVILDYCKQNNLETNEQDMRDYVKDIAKLAGVHGRNIKVHSGRHSFAMLMLEKGLSVDEVAELLGDSKDVARRYARITNKHLHDKILTAMGDL